MTLRTRLEKLERARPGAFNALGELLASVAPRGLRFHERPAGPAIAADAAPDGMADALDVLRRATSLPFLSQEI